MAEVTEAGDAPAPRKSSYYPNAPSVQRQQALRSRPRRIARITSDQIRLLRSRMGWTQEELARRLIVDTMTISRWERGLRQPQNKYHVILRRWAGLDEGSQRPSI